MRLRPGVRLDAAGGGQSRMGWMATGIAPEGAAQNGSEITLCWVVRGLEGAASW